MGRTKKIKTDQLYGDYDGLSGKQIDYVKIATNPEVKLRGLTEKEIADILGVGEKTPRNWRQQPNVREAIYKETMLKAAEELPTMLTELRKLCTQDKDMKAKVQALALWCKINGVIADSKEKIGDSTIDKSVEQRLLEIGERFRHNIVQSGEQ